MQDGLIIVSVGYFSNSVFKIWLSPFGQCFCDSSNNRKYSDLMRKWWGYRQGNSGLAPRQSGVVKRAKPAVLALLTSFSEAVPSS